MKFQFWWQFCQNANYNTRKSNNNHKAHAIATKETKKSWKISTGYTKMGFKKVSKIFFRFSPLDQIWCLHWPVSHERAIIDHKEHLFSESIVSKDSSTYLVSNSVIVMATITTFSKYIIADSNDKKRKISTLMAGLWWNTLRITNKLKYKHALQVLVTKENKNNYSLF